MIAKKKVQIAGKVAGNCHSDNAATVEIKYHYNGSGPQAFGGVHKWPVITVKIGFDVSTPDRVIEEVANALVEICKVAYEYNGKDYGLDSGQVD